MVRSDALFRKISLKFDAPSSELRVIGDRIQLQQAILNLVLNAFDAVSEAVGEREVSTSIVADGDKIKVTVSDTGIGIDPASISHLFEPFYTTKPRGMGMGLAVTSSIVKAHGGHLSARRNPDKGSTFEIVLRALGDGVTQ
jgi:two-component system sensor kinase FixL